VIRQHPTYNTPAYNGIIGSFQCAGSMQFFDDLIEVSGQPDAFLIPAREYF
jgi:hypothetical protein